MAKKTVVKNKINREKGIVIVTTTVEETDQNGDVTVTETEEEYTLEEWENSKGQKSPFVQRGEDSSTSTPKKVHFSNGSPEEKSRPLPTPHKSPQSSLQRSPQRSTQKSPRDTNSSYTTSSYSSTPSRTTQGTGKHDTPRSILRSPPKSSPGDNGSLQSGVGQSGYSRGLGQSPVKNNNASKKHISTMRWKYEQLEFDILFYINLVRQQPQKMLPLLYERQKYYRENIYRIPGKVPIRTEEGVNAVLDAIEFLKTQKSLDTLKYSMGMSQAARDHILDLGQKGLTGTNSSTYPHHTYKDRIEMYGFITGQALAEHISYGSDKAQTIVLDLLIDDGDLSRSHRRHLFSTEWKYIGIGFGEHTKLRTMCVIEFCDGYRDTDLSISMARKPISTLNEDTLSLEDLEDVNYSSVPTQRIKHIMAQGPAPKLGGATLYQSGHDLGVNLYSPYSTELCKEGNLLDFIFTLKREVDRTKLFIVNNDKWYEVMEHYMQGELIYHGRLTKVERGKVGILHNNTFLLRFDVI